MSGKKARQHRRENPSSHEQEDWQQVADAVRARDLAYFATHPGVHGYNRSRVPGEFGPGDRKAVGRNDVVYVHQDRPGHIHRHIGKALRSSDYPTGHIPEEHAEAFFAHYGIPLETVTGLDAPFVEDQTP